MKSNNFNSLNYRLLRAAAVIVVVSVILLSACTKESISQTQDAGTTENQTELTTDTKKTSGSLPTIAAPPYEALVEHIYTADPSAHVYDGRLFIYGSHDQDELFPSDNDGGGYRMIDYHVLSIDSFEQPTVDHGKAFTVEDVVWAEKQLWAPDCAYKNGKYYFYFPAKDYDGIFRIGAAVGDKPEGPFAPLNNYIEGSFSMDPTVFIDDNQDAYMIFGGIWGGQLERWQTGTYDPDGITPSGSEPALGPVIARMSEDMLEFASEPEELAIVYENGDPIPAMDEDRRFFEGAWLHKYQDTYYLSYSTGTTHLLVYATSDNIMGPYIYQGKILDPVAGWTTHHSIVEYDSQWYLFYHDAALSGQDTQRNSKYAPLTYSQDGSIEMVKLPK